MRTWILASAFLFACSGSDTGGDGDTNADNGGGDDDDAPPINGGTDPDDLGCDEIPEYDNLGNFDCKELWAALDATVEAAQRCHDASDCRTLAIACENWDQAGCFAIANTCIGSRDLDKFHPEANGENCDVSVPGFPDNDCQCSGLPEADCVGGFCAEKFTPP